MKGILKNKKEGGEKKEREQLFHKMKMGFY